MKQIGASLMVADMLNIGQEIRNLDAAGIDFYHIDIMDGNFVRNFALSPDFIKAMRPITQKPIDVHLMVQNPEDHIDAVAAAGADMISIHAETATHLQGALSHIRSLGKKAGVALNPATPITILEHIWDVVDIVLVMTVNPGFAGQKFIPAMYDKVAMVRDFVKAHNPNILIEVDGNIGPQTIPQCSKNGADLYVAGTSTLFNDKGTYAENLKATRALF